MSDKKKELILIPQSFQVQNIIVDEIIKYLNGSEVKILLVLIRQTLGWHKWKDNISITQFMEFTGLSNRAVIDALSFLKSINLVIRINGKATRKGYVYKLNINWGESDKNILIKKRSSEESSPVKKVHQCTKFTNTGEESSPVNPLTGEESSHTETHIINQTKPNINNITSPNGEEKPPEEIPRKSKSKTDPEVNKWLTWYIANHPNSYFVTNWGEAKNKIKSIKTYLIGNYPKNDVFEKFKNCAKIFWEFRDSYILKENHSIRHFHYTMNRIINALKLEEELY